MKKTTGICCCCVLLGMALSSHPTQAAVSIDVQGVGIYSYFDTLVGYLEDEDVPSMLPDNPMTLPLSTSVDVPGGTVACTSTFSTRTTDDSSIFWAGFDVLLENAYVFALGTSATNVYFALDVTSDEPFTVVYDFDFVSDYEPPGFFHYAHIVDLASDETYRIPGQGDVYLTEIQVPPGSYRITHSPHFFPTGFGTAEGSFSIAIVPEPSTLALTSFALLGLAFYGWRRRK